MKKFNYWPLTIFTLVNIFVWWKSIEVIRGSSTSERSAAVEYPSVKLNLEEDCSEDPSCSPGCKVCCQLPYNKDNGKLEVHHFFTNRGLWNDFKRFESLPLTAGNTIMYAGGNTHGSDGVNFMKQCPQCVMHIYEPVPQYYASLEKVWAEHVRTNNWVVKVHQYGLGDDTKTIHLSEADLQGQGTFGMKETERNDTKKIKLDIVDAATAFNNVTGDDLDFFHVNCEGCEYEMLENMINFNLHKKIKIIQFGTHYFPQVTRLTERYCKIREELGKTHRMVYGEAFAWERWDRKI